MQTENSPLLRMHEKLLIQLHETYKHKMMHCNMSLVM